MRLPFDVDLLASLYTLGVIVFGSFPRLRRNSLAIPFQFNCEEVPPSAVTEAQSKFLATYDAKLAAMNYWPVSTFRATNYGNNLIRGYSNAAETSRCVVMLIATTVRLNGKSMVTNSCTVEFISKFADDRVLITRNAKIKVLSDNPDYRVVQECPTTSEPSELKRRHDGQAATMGPVEWPPTDAASIFKQVNREHARFSAYQLARGLYRLHPAGNGYVLTDKTHWRGIRNFLNPFAHHFSLPSLLSAIAVGVALPVLGILRLAPQAAHAERGSAFPPILAAELTVAACYLIAGAAVGYLLERHTFVWAFLITYIGVHIVVGWNPQPLPYSLIAGLIAHAVARAKCSSRVVLGGQIPLSSVPFKPFG